MIQFVSTRIDVPTQADDRPRPASLPEVARNCRGQREDLGDEIARLSAHIQAATGRLLDLIRAFDESEGWYEEGFKSCAQWLSWRTGVGPSAAREKVRVAKALGTLPELRGALACGELSYSVARAITRVATPENEAVLVEAARFTPASDMERLVGAWAAADRSEMGERERHAQRRLSLTPEADGSWRISGRLDPEVGAVLSRALDAAAELLYARETGAFTDPAQTAEGAEPVEADFPAAARHADAIGLVAEAALGRGLDQGDHEPRVVSRAERFQVVMHVSAETDAKTDGVDDTARAVSELVSPDVASIDDGPHVSAETARRLACDAGLVEMTHDGDENVLDVGRRRRTVPTALRRALDRRDRGCRFPGCLSRFCDAHHIEHWADGGETAIENLVLLCRHHHRRVHEDGWTVELTERGEARFHRPNGRLLPHVPDRPRAPENPAHELELVHQRCEIEIDPWTPTPQWNGERFDVDWALYALSGSVRVR